MDAEVEKVRMKIDEIDDQIIKLLRERMNLCRELGVYKKGRGLPIRSPEREEYILSRTRPFNNIFREIIRLCIEVEKAV